MLAKRIIPCLDIDKGRVVKGVNFRHLKDAGSALKNALFYDKELADELVFLDITASWQRRKIVINLVKRVSRKLFIPFTVGGGIKNLEEIGDILRSGADKVSINTHAVRKPDFVTQAARRFGNQCIVVAIDAKKTSAHRWGVFIEGGRKKTSLDAVSWAKEIEKRGAGEILLTSMDFDGTKDGYDYGLTRRVSRAVKIPVIASGGAGKPEHFYEVLTYGGAQAALAASVFHYRRYSVKYIKNYLKRKGVEVRL